MFIIKEKDGIKRRVCRRKAGDRWKRVIADWGIR